MLCRREVGCFASLFFLIFFLPAATTFDWPFTFPFSKVPIGRYTFYGSVKCGNGNPVLPEAKVVLMEYDPVTLKDFLSQSLIQNGMFELSGTATDPASYNDDLEVFIKFYDVCKLGELKRSGTLNVDGYTHYTILDNDDYDIAVDDTSG